ncbi:MAG: HEAT repeat domain-containing protein [Planctomycetes bacterium]|nr:HEAT repeat domain-containing protein [Planctomycetota bacterium]
MGRWLSFTAAVAALCLSGCLGTPPAEEGAGPEAAPPAAEAAGAEGTEPGSDAMTDAIVTIGDAGGDLFQELAIFLGADRRPGYALRVIRDVHDLRDWSYRLDVPRAVEKCRDALSDLTVSDYAEWDETGMTVVVVSTLAQRDASALVRNDCVRVLSWFHDWIHPLSAAIPAGEPPDQEGVLDALRALESIMKKETPFADPADRMVFMDGVAVLGTYPWAELALPDAKLARNRVAQPRGVVRALAGRTFRDGRSDPLLADTLDRALIRVTDHVLSLSLLACLADSAAHVRAAAARALGERRIAGAAPVIARVLPGEPESSVRIALVGVLGDLGETGEDVKALAIPALAGLLEDPNDSVRRAAARELAGLTFENPGPDVSDWQRWWRERNAEPAGP